jgi:hypothetical protein
MNQLKKLSLLFASLVFALGLYAQNATDISQTTQTFAQQSILASSTARVAHLNASLQIIYDGAVRDYNLNMGSGVSKIAPQVPVAPFKWELAPPDKDGYVWYQQSTERITSTIPLATVNLGGLTVPVRDSSHIDVGKQIGNTKWYSVGPLDGTPSGFITPPQADGHTYQKFGAPVGAGWYLQVS